MYKRQLILGFFLVLLAAGGGFYAMTRTPQVVVSMPVRGTAAELVYATGVVQAVAQVDVAPEVSGRITAQLVAEGDKVALGQPLLELSREEEEAEVAHAQAQAENDRLHLRRAEGLWQRKVGSLEEYENAKAAFARAQAQLAAAQARLAKRTLRAPLAAQVLRREGEVGDTVTPGTVLVTLGDPQKLRVEVQVDEEDIPRVSKEQTVLLSNDAFPNKVFTAQVSEITPLGDSTSKTWRVRADLPADTPLPAGMSVEANIVIRQHEGVWLLPASAVREGQILRVEAGRIRAQAVELGIIGVDKTEILSPLTGQEQIITQPEASLTEGMRVRSTAEQQAKPKTGP